MKTFLPRLDFIPRVALTVALVFSMSGNQLLAQTKTEQAESLRQEMEQKAKNKIGYPDAYDFYAHGLNRNQDYYALAQQISRLSAFLEAFRQTSRSIYPSGLPGAHPPLNGLSADPKDIYGPDGPTTRTVKVFLEYRLMVGGNPRLRAGNITEDSSKIYARVETTDGALVEEFEVDKKTGAWTPVR